MSFKSEEEAKEKTCIFLHILYWIREEGYTGPTTCMGLECAQYKKAAHGCGLV